MKIPLYLAAAFVAIAAVAVAQTKECKCGNSHHSAYRSEAADRNPPKTQVKSQSVGIQEITSKWHPQKIGKEKRYPREDSVYSVRGYLRLVRIDPDECGIYLEIAASASPSAVRIVARIPNTKAYCRTRDILLQSLKYRYGVEQIPSSGKEFLGGNLPEIIVTGYAFLNNEEVTQGGKYVRTRWGVRPAFDARIIEPASNSRY